MQSKKHELVSQYKALRPLINELCEILMRYTETRDPKKDPVHVVFDIDDTLIFDDNRQTPNIQIKHLLDLATEMGCKVHLVTAREKSDEVIRWTRDELRRHNIRYDTLALCPKRQRVSMDRVAKWKHSERTKHSPCFFSVGDQWGDSVLLESEEAIEALNKTFNTEEWPWILFKPADGVPIYGVKLMAHK